MKLPRSRFLKLLGLGLAGASKFQGSVSAEDGKPDAPLKLGIVTDCQFVDADTKGKRFYRNSPAKLTDALDHLNAMGDLDAVFHLGDMIDRDFMSYDAILPIFKTVKPPLHYLIGNHDYAVPDDLKSKVAGVFGLKETYYSFVLKNWRFILLDGNVQSLFSKPKDDPATAAAAEFKKATKHRALPEWGGGLGETQRQWLESELVAAKAANQKALLFCHYPVLPITSHSLWDAEAVLEILKPHSTNIAAWFNGHNHDGNYMGAHGIHFVNFRGMVDTTHNCYARMEISAKEIKIQGYGREPSRALSLPALDSPAERPLG